MSGPIEVSLARARELVADGAQLVEVLPAEEYEEEHLPGAVNLPLKELTRSRASALDVARAVIVYCWNDT
jgi:rhodanese-related sulfurtransferase